MPLQDLPFSIFGCRPLEKVARAEARQIYSRVRLRVDKAVRVPGCMVEQRRASRASDRGCPTFVTSE